MKKLIAPLSAIALLLSIGVPTLAQTTSASAVKSVLVGQGATTTKKTTGKMAKGKMAKGKMAKGKMAKGKMAKGKMAKGKMAKGKMSGSTPK